jgi:hypothetical protein
MDLRGIACGGMDWIHLAQDRDQCQSLANRVMILRFRKVLGHSSVAWRLEASLEGLISMELVNYSLSQLVDPADGFRFLILLALVFLIHIIFS